MRARSWLALFFVAVLVPAAHGTSMTATMFSEPPGDARFNSIPVSDVADPPILVRTHRLSTISATEFEKLPVWNFGTCEPGSCYYSLRAAALSERSGDSGSARTAASSGAYTDRPASEAMSLLDAALMMLFAGALVAYQLDRKQRELRHSSLWAVRL